ncbi:hypothetical protein [Conexibacter sp. SYSU D00693]|uniref:hypothetical protein n=1 Tax=Conexibacter sp. SYSU D00693 TaxID=2812560 RepID=UPI00196B20E3|nr:hypothetical protein [Conexibacter sp. SYSU D00693]
MPDQLKERTPPPEDLLAEAIADYERYLEIASVSQIAMVEEPEVAPASVPPLGLVLWPS